MSTSFISLQVLQSKRISFPTTGCPRKNATDLKNSNGNCLILITKRLFLLKSAIIRINFDIFTSKKIGDLVRQKSANLKVANTLEYRINGGGVRTIGGLEMVRHNNNREAGIIGGAAWRNRK